MATRTIARMFDDYSDATAAVRALEAAGFSNDDVSLVANQGDGATNDTTDTNAGTGTATGASIGTLLGGGAGLLAGIGALAIPGIGPIVAAGWLVAALTGAGVGAAAGGLLGGLTSAGVSDEDAQVYAEGVRRGGNLVTVRADETRAMQAESILNGHNPVDPQQRAMAYRQGGWTRFDEDAGPYTGPRHGAVAGSAMAAGGTMLSDAPDGTPGNPPGTAAGRAVDRTLGTNVSGAHPEHESPRNDPPGSAAGRTADRTLGTNVSGAYPQHSDGMPSNPPGTAAGRAADRTLDTNVSGTNPKI